MIKRVRERLNPDLEAKAIVVCSVLGTTARMVARFRSPVNVIGRCVNEKVWRKLSLSRGVAPVLSQVLPSIEALFYTAKRMVADVMAPEKGDKVIITGGSVMGQAGQTNTIRIETI